MSLKSLSRSINWLEYSFGRKVLSEVLSDDEQVLDLLMMSLESLHFVSLIYNIFLFLFLIVVPAANFGTGAIAKNISVFDELGIEELYEVKSSLPASKTCFTTSSVIMKYLYPNRHYPHFSSISNHLMCLKIRQVFISYIGYVHSKCPYRLQYYSAFITSVEYNAVQRIKISIYHHSQDALKQPKPQKLYINTITLNHILTECNRMHKH